MPELPEVETMRRGLEKIVGLRIHSVSFPAAKRLRSLLFKPSPQRLKTRLLSLVITGIRRIGKRIVIDFNSDESLVIEPRMTGLLLLALRVAALDGLERFGEWWGWRWDVVNLNLGELSSE